LFTGLGASFHACNVFICRYCLILVLKFPKPFLFVSKSALN
jgi:hypothetical protein